jgi:hypothetical protein
VELAGQRWLPNHATLNTSGRAWGKQKYTHPGPEIYLRVSGKGGLLPSFSKDALIQVLNSAQNCGSSKVRLKE